MCSEARTVNRRDFTKLCAAGAFSAVGLGAKGASADLFSRPLQADRVVCVKHMRRLYLMRGEVILRSYKVALGRFPRGHKIKEGDNRTPEGRYLVDYHLRESSFHRALHISYPNPNDMARAGALGVSPGGQIMIHGLPNDKSATDVGHPVFDWTNGCIAVTNDEIMEIWNAVEDGTPIEIIA